MKKYFIVLTLSLGLVLAPSSAYASNLLLLNGSDSIVPTACHACPCGVAGAFQFVQNIMNVMISIGVIFMIFFIVWAGFLFITSVANPESRSKARSMLINAFIGMIIVLAGWLIVDYIMKALNGGNDTTFGPWNKILQVSDPNGSCIVPKPPQPIAGLPGAGGGAVGAPGAGGGTPSGGSSGCGPVTLATFPSYASGGGTVQATPDTIKRFLAMREVALSDGVTLKAHFGYRSVFVCFGNPV